VPKADSVLILDDTLCEHVGSLFEYVDRHYNHGDDTYRLRTIPSPVITSAAPYVFLWLCVCIGAMKNAPAGKRSSTTLSRPCHSDKKKERTRFHKDVDPVLLKDPAFQTLHEQFRTKIDLGIDLLETRYGTKCRLGSSCSIVGISPTSWCPWPAITKKTGSAC